MRYIINLSQAHTLIFKFLDYEFSDKNFVKELNPYYKDGNTYTIEIFNNSEDLKMTYFWYGPGEYDDGTPHNGTGSLHINPDLVDNLRRSLSLRESKIIDIIADWVTEKLNMDIDEIELYPNRENPPSY